MKIGFIELIQDTLATIGICMLLFVIYDTWGEK